MHKNAFKALLAYFIFFQSGLFALADLSFVVIDIKYNQKQGVKICEMQPGSFSRFSGIDFLEQSNTVPNLYCKLLSQYNTPCYFTHPLYQNMKKAFIKHEWTSTHSPKALIATLEEKIPGDPDDLFGYSGFLFSLQIEYITKKYPTLFPQILFLDRAILPYSQNKYVMNCLFESIEETKNLRPKWRVYKKGVSQKLINLIDHDIPGDIIVIKPIQSTMGRGVIILKKEDLQKTLEYIFLSEKEVLLKDIERSYSQYAIDTSEYFIVEEFIESDPLILGDEQLPYDCTMRIMAILSYHQRKADITFLKEYWYSPKYPIEDSYSLIQSHKAKGTFFSKVDPEVIEKVQKQLSPALLKAYQKMLDEYENAENIKLILQPFSKQSEHKFVDSSVSSICLQTRKEIYIPK